MAKGFGNTSDFEVICKKCGGINITADEVDGYIYLICLSCLKKEEEEKAKEIIKSTLEENNISEKKQIGLAMKAVMPKLKGKLDGSKIKDLVLELLD